MVFVSSFGLNLQDFFRVKRDVTALSLFAHQAMASFVPYQDDQAATVPLEEGFQELKFVKKHHKHAVRTPISKSLLLAFRCPTLMHSTNSQKKSRMYRSEKGCPVFKAG